jgi:hypothetical protein
MAYRCSQTPPQLLDLRSRPPPFMLLQSRTNVGSFIENKGTSWVRSAKLWCQPRSDTSNTAFIYSLKL